VRAARGSQTPNEIGSGAVDLREHVVDRAYDGVGHESVDA
jgi:hypothetical protein